MKSINSALLNLALLTQLVSCSSGSGNRNTAPDGAGGASGTSSAGRDGGNAGVPPDTRFDGESSGDRDAGGADGVGMTAFDPSVAIPSHDCRSDTSANCISIAGTYEGEPIDVFCNVTGDKGKIVSAGKWVIGCNHLNPGFAMLYVPIKPSGGFSETVVLGEKPGMNFEFSARSNTSVTLFSRNLVRADLAGTIAFERAPYLEVTGTFHGKWVTQEAECTGFAGSACATADINVTFRVRTDYGSCFNDSECTPPETCDTVAFRCL